MSSPGTPPVVETSNPGKRMEVLPAPGGRLFVSVTWTVVPSVTTSVGPGTCIVPLQAAVAAMAVGAAVPPVAQA